MPGWDSSGILVCPGWGCGVWSGCLVPRDSPRRVGIGVAVRRRRLCGVTEEVGMRCKGGFSCGVAVRLGTTMGLVERA